MNTKEKPRKYCIQLLNSQAMIITEDTKAEFFDNCFASVFTRQTNEQKILQPDH